MPECGVTRRVGWCADEVGSIYRATDTILAEGLQDLLAIVRAIDIFFIERHAGCQAGRQRLAVGPNLARISRVGLDRPDLIGPFPLNISQERIPIRKEDV